jgi:toxin ParE1/3/4
VKIVYTEDAERDLDAVALYTEEVWGAAQCDLYVNMLDETIQHVLTRATYLLEVPNRPGLYRHHAERHHIYFTRASDQLTVVRILHDSMLPERHL